MSHRHRALVIVLGLLAGVHAHAQPPATIYDVVIRGGTVIDGSGAPRYRADVAISGGSIARVGDLTGARGTREIDATSRYVTPGFINIHSHATPDGLTNAANMLMQGVTTELLNADGAGPLDIRGQLATAEARGLAINIATAIGFNSVWADVVGLADRRPTAAEIERMRAQLAAALEAGAWGLSAGLDYKPGYYATTEDVIRIVDVARASRTFFTNHDRVTPESGFSSIAGMAETIAIGARSGVTPIVTHMKVQGHEQGRAADILRQMREATDRGTYTAADVYPYLAGQTGLVALIIPGWAQDGGREAMLKRFADPALRARIVREAEAAMTARFGGAAGVYLPATKQQLTAVMQAMGVSAGEAVVRLLEQGSPGIIASFGIEADLVAILQHPTSSVACDCGAVAGDASHPRYFGSFPRVLGRYVREQKALTWEDAIRKMTGLPAATIGLVDRGWLAPGMAADVVVFDPATIIDHATFEAPTRPSEGVQTVIMNGQVVLDRGAVTGVKAGRALRRGPHMPTRPMTPGGRRTMSHTVTRGGTDAAVDVAQAAGAPAATGTVRLQRASDGVALSMTTFGHIQTAPNWASLTGRGRVRPGDPEVDIVIISDGDTLHVQAGPFSYSSTR
jgi:N-acyl-D-aspartate/D-glutamate deacylase